MGWMVRPPNSSVDVLTPYLLESGLRRGDGAKSGHGVEPAAM